MGVIIDHFGRKYDSSELLIYSRRLTSSFFRALPTAFEHFDAYIYAIVKRKKDKDIAHIKWGTDVRLDPCVLDWKHRRIIIYIPLNINVGITSIDDLHPDFYEAVEAAFLALMQGMIP